MRNQSADQAANVAGVLQAGVQRSASDASGGEPASSISAHLLQALTTEHFTLQTGRSATIFDSTGRATLYLSTVSSAVVALAFIGQASQIGQTFFLFALAVLPALFVLGVVTFLRLIASAVEDMFYARAINRIRHAYLVLDPAATQYFLLSGNDDDIGVFANMGMHVSRWHLASHTASLILVINSFIGGVFTALVLHHAIDMAVVASAAIGGVVTLAVGVVGMWYHRRRWRAAVQAVPTLFPSVESPGQTARMM